MLNSIIAWSLKNRLIVTCLAALGVVYGGIVIKNLPVDVFPDLNRPTVNIMAEAGGMAPEEVEILVTLPLETVLNGLPGVQRVRTSSGVGLSVVYVEFDWGTDIYKNRQLVAEKLSLVQEKLPAGVTPVMGPISSIMGEFQLIGLYSKDNSISAQDVRGLADWSIRPRLMSIPGISQVISIGGGVKQYQILISVEKLQKTQLSLDDVEKALRSVNKNSTGGFIDIDKKEYLIRNIGQIRSIEELENSVVGTNLGRPIFVKDIAEVKTGSMVKRGDGSVNGRPAVIMSIQKQPGASTIDLTAQIEQNLKAMEKTLPPSVVIEKNLFKQADFIERAIANVEEALRDGAIFVAIVLFIFLMNFRTTLITLTAIPLSFVITAIVMKFFGISINTMTLGGLAVAIGELVDDAIVDVENVFRRLRENAQSTAPKAFLRVIFEASSEIRNSIVLATLIVVLVFVPLFYLSGIEGRLFIPLGISYIVSILSSLLVSLTVTPVLCSYLLRNFQHMKLEKEGHLVRWLKKIDGKMLHVVLDRPLIPIAVVFVIFILSLGLLPFMGKDFLPKFNEGTATISLILSPGVSLEESNRIGTEAEKLVLSVPEVKSVARRTGRAELDEHAEGVHSSEIDVDFKQTGRAREVVLEDLRKKLAGLDGAFVSIGQPISHRLDHLLSGVRAQVAIKVFGPQLSTLRAKSAEIYTALKEIKGVVDLQIEQQVLIPQVKIQILREEAAKYAIVSGELVDNLEMALNGEVVGQVIDQQRYFDVMMRFDENSRSDPEAIKKTTIKIMPDGSKIALEKIADVYLSDGPNLINRENMQRRMVVSANASGRDLSSLVQEIQQSIDSKVEIPEGHFITYGGQFESQQAASKLIFFLGLLSLIAIFIVLYSHFKSSFIAFQIMLNIPMALIGSIVAIFLSDRILSVATLVAFVTLCGITSRNGIMMISHYLHLMEHEGEKFSKQMVIRGSLERLIPVLMTALTAGLALVPLVLSQGGAGKEILHPVAVVILGGLMSSTLLDMFVTPAIFYRFGRKSSEYFLKRQSNQELL